MFSKSCGLFKCTYFSGEIHKKPPTLYRIIQLLHLFSLYLSWYMEVFLRRKNRLKAPQIFSWKGQLSRQSQRRGKDNWEAIMWINSKSHFSPWKISRCLRIGQWQSWALCLLCAITYFSTFQLALCALWPLLRM